jgi:hypothetical protein
MKASHGHDELFRKPRGRPLKFKNEKPIQTQIDKKRTRPGVQMSHLEPHNDENLQIGGVI